jgi:hypothetical protein
MAAIDSGGPFAAESQGLREAPMKLAAQKIPDRFARALPRGLRLVSRTEGDFLLVEAAFCPRGHSLIVDSVRIHDEASVKLKLVAGESSGFVFVDAFWGSHSKLFSFIPLAPGKKPLVVDARCPYCDISMNEQHPCSEKGCPSDASIRLLLPGGKNTIHVCARLGCPGHLLDVVDMPRGVVRTVSGINYFGVGGEDLFGGL